MRPRQLAHFGVARSQLAANASVFVAHWRSDIAHFGNYNALARAAARELDLAGLLAGFSAEQLTDCMTFEDVELRVVQDLKQRIVSGAGANMDVVHALIARRRDGHWANPLLASANERTRALAACYDALSAAADFFSLKASHAAGFSFPDAGAPLPNTGTSCSASTSCTGTSTRPPTRSNPRAGRCCTGCARRSRGVYSGWFIPQLSTAWAKVMEGPQGLLKGWALPEVTPQQAFFERKVLPLFDGGVKRVFVVISDAFRFEVAHELVQHTNSKSRFKASLDAMLGVLPSYTALGMAALLPHQTLAYKEKVPTWMCWPMGTWWPRWSSAASTSSPSAASRSRPKT
jgi:hypothetical protein